MTLMLMTHMAINIPTWIFFDPVRQLGLKFYYLE